MATKSKTIEGFKGFDKDLKCRDYQYEVGKDYTHKGTPKACDAGFHFCENPIDVFGYYPPADGRYCAVTGSGKSDTKEDKVAVSKIHIGAEIGLKGLIDAAVKFTFDRVKWEEAKESNTGDQSAATNTGDYSAATNTGDQSAATVEGKESIAIVTGLNSKARGALGCWIVLTERGDWNGETYPIKEVRAVKVDGENIKPMVFYKLTNGEVVEVA